MRKIKEVLRLIYEQRLSARQVARAAGLSRSTVAAYRQRFEQAGLSRPDADGIDDAMLERVTGQTWPFFLAQALLGNLSLNSTRSRSCPHHLVFAAPPISGGS